MTARDIRERAGILAEAFINGGASDRGTVAYECEQGGVALTARVVVQLGRYGDAGELAFMLARRQEERG